MRGAEDVARHVPRVDVLDASLEENQRAGVVPHRPDVFREPDWPTVAAVELDLDRLESLLTARTRVVVVNFPHNPTGYQSAREELDAIVAFARRHGLVLFSDEMYRYLELHPQARLPAAVECYEQALEMDPIIG